MDLSVQNGMKSSFHRKGACIKMFKKCFREYGEDIENLKDLLNRQREKLDSYSRRISDMEYENEKLKRILENYIPGRITYRNISKCLTVFESDRFKFNYLYLYKDGKEFCINNLKLNNPTFPKKDDSNQENVVCVKDDIGTKKEFKYREYVIDLNSCTYIRTK